MRQQQLNRMIRLAGVFVLFTASVHATPANKAALEKHYDKFLSAELSRCTTCHSPATVKNPESLDEFPHNPFGDRLRAVGKELSRAGKKKDIPSRLMLIAKEDSDGDGVPNEMELLLGHNPGDGKDTPTKKELSLAKKRTSEFQQLLASYRWQPFEKVNRPALPKVKNTKWARNPIDLFVAAEQGQHKLKPRPEAPKTILLRRLYLDLIGLSPTPEEQRTFESDTAPDAYEKVVDRLLNDPRYGERWGRHWMDVWRYSDWAGWSGGNQIRDSKPHIWRWRDWIVESLNADKGYDRMLVEMLAADELAPEDTNMVRATGFLARNYKMLSREQWLEDTVKHTSQAFLGVTMGCAKCHNHMYDPFTQKEYYQMRAIFEPHQVRTDRVPGELDLNKNGLVRVYDVNTNPATYLFIRGDERSPDTNRVLWPGVPRALCGESADAELKTESVKLPQLVANPDKRRFVMDDALTASQKALAEARTAWQKIKTNAATTPEKMKEEELTFAIAEAREAEVRAVIHAEELEDKKSTEEWKQAAREAFTRQRAVALAEARLKFAQAQTAQTDAQKRADEAGVVAVSKIKSDANSTTNQIAAVEPKDKKTKDADQAVKDLEAANKKLADTRIAHAEAEKKFQATPETAFKARSMDTYPDSSTGRRLAFARWVANRENPLTARVAMNHIWLRHFGRGIVNTPADFGRNGSSATHPALLDWLASEFMAQNWSMKAMHRLIATSSTYRMTSTSDEANAKVDPDNIYLWRMPSRRMEAESVRDNMLYVSGSLDPAMGGPDIDHSLGLTSRRRSVYLRNAAEKEVEFLKLFDGPSVTECYQRRPTVLPQQALAMANSELPFVQSKSLAKTLFAECAGSEEKFVTRAFERVLARRPTKEEARLCQSFLRGPEQPPAKTSPAAIIPAANVVIDPKTAADKAARAREHLILVLFNHNDFVTIR